MKVKIDGKTYDTDTSKQLGEWHNHRYNSNETCAEALYRKRNGEYFLFGAGGAQSRYAENRGNGEWAEGEQIIPLTDEAAQEWAEKKLTAEQYVALFGQGNNRLYTFLLSDDTIEKIERNAEKADISPSAYLESLIP